MLLKYVDGGVQASIVPEPTTTSLRLSELREAKLKLAPMKRTAINILNACHTRMHGSVCEVEGCASARLGGFSREGKRRFHNLLKSLDEALDARDAGANARRQTVPLRLDFVAERFFVVEKVSLRLCGAPLHTTAVREATSTPQTAPLPTRRVVKAEAVAAPEVGARLSLDGSRVSLQLRVGGRSALNFGAAQRDVRPHLAAQARWRPARRERARTWSSSRRWPTRRRKRR